MLRRTAGVLLGAVLAGCPQLVYENRPCDDEQQCLPGYRCDVASNTCVPGGSGGGTGGGGGGGTGGGGAAGGGTGGGGAVDTTPSATASTITVSPASVPADGTSAALVTVTVRNGSGQPLQGLTVSVSFSGSATVTDDAPTTNASGEASFSVRSMAAESGTLLATVDAAAGSVQLVDQPTLTFTALTWSLGGTVAGLTTSGLVLASPGQPDLAVPSGATTFTFATLQQDGSSYDVTVKAQPAQLRCSVSMAAGTVTADVTSVAVQCAALAIVSAGSAHTAVLGIDGVLTVWGLNQYGQLGDGTTFSGRATVGAPSTWATVETGNSHTLAIKTDGSLWAWGYNSNRQLGDGTSTSRSSPVPVGGDTDWRALSAGNTVSAAIKRNGTLWAWGTNINQTAQGMTVVPSPGQIGTDTDWDVISVGADHMLALKTDGSLWSWGTNGGGQLGDGTSMARATPTRVGTAFWRAVAAGSVYSVAVRADGSLWAWGVNGQGQLGDGSTTGKTVPVRVGTDSDWSLVAAGGNHSLALKQDGSLWGFGSNSSGQLGDGTTMQRTSPTQIGTDTDWVAIAAGNNFSVAAKSDGTVWGWGSNGNGQTGTLLRRVPEQVGKRTDWVAISAGSQHALGLTDGGTAWLWGTHLDPDDADAGVRNLPMQALPGQATAVAAGSLHSLITATDGGLYALGSGPGVGAGVLTVDQSPARPVTVADWYTVSSASWPVVVDLSGDGRLDVAALGASQVAVLLNAGGGQLGAPNGYPTLGGMPSGLVSADFDNDNRADLAVATNAGVEVLLNSGGGMLGASISYAIVGTNPYELVAADFNGDGLPDLATLSEQGATKTISTLINQGGGMFGAAAPGPVTSSLVGLASGDLNGDGRDDLVVSSTGARFYVMLSAATGTFPTSTLVSTCPANFPGTVLLDLNGDGALDVATPGTNGVCRSLNSGMGTFPAGTLLDSTVGALWPVDVDGDGKLDLLAARPGDPTPLTVLRNTGADALTTVARYDIKQGIGRVVPARLDGVNLSIVVGAGSAVVVHRPGPLQAAGVQGGSNFGFGIAPDRSLWGWGSNSSWQVFSDARTLPWARQTSSDPWRAVAPGGSRILGIKTDGSLWRWGAISSMLRIGVDTDWASAAVGNDTTGYVLKSNGRLYSCLLSNGGLSFVGTATDWASISAGPTHQVALKTNGTLWAWGTNTYGQLGDGTVTSQASPVQIGTDTDWVSAVAGGTRGFTLAIKSDGSLWTWGDNTYGELGLAAGSTLVPRVIE